jgi:hypothetical protein
VVQAALRVEQAAEAVEPRKLPIFQGQSMVRNRVVRNRGPRFNETLSKVEVLWQLGNYFKHRDEWDRAWNKKRNVWEWFNVRDVWTNDTISAAGLSPGNESENLRRGAEALGNTQYTDVAVFQKIICSWSDDVRNHIYEKLGRPL